MSQPLEDKLLALEPHIGTKVTDVDRRRFPRQLLDRKFDSLMLQSNGATLFGLRRIGKSTEAGACCERLRAAGWYVVEEDAQGKTSEGELLLAILRQLPEAGLQSRLTKMFHAEGTITQVLRDALSKFTGRPEDIQAYFSQIAAVIERAIEAQERIVLVVDEFPWLCRSILQGDAQKGRQRVDLLLAALRKWRGKGMRMLLMGSIGMVALGRRYGLDLSHLNDLQPLHVPPLTVDEARRMCAALALGSRAVGWTEGHTDALIDETVALYPVMVQKGFQALTLGDRAAALDEIAELFAESVRPDLDAAYYTQFDERLKLYAELPAPLPSLLPWLLDRVLEAPAPLPRDALDSAAATLLPDAASIEAGISDALHILREDGFLTFREERDGSQQWRVASGLVSAWRRQRRGARRR